MPGPSQSATSVGGSRSPSSKQVSARGASGSGQVRQRKGASTSGRTSRSVAGGGTGASGGGMWRFYTEDSPGLKVGPVPVLVMSLIFIASVFMLHIWGKYTRA
ncbi:protein transport protein Sec61 subunit beta-like [Patiria miniata]|uniref:Protein transport protein Sec61 subunit beta n=1 Tax=Patiria miniata TaxID=46514 RepID=A0A913ZDN5_PATMI|nr:protein transport protein Sec61 subunit beta-like [Patiria miniata]